MLVLICVDGLFLFLFFFRCACPPSSLHSMSFPSGFTQKLFPPRYSRCYTELTNGRPPLPFPLPLLPRQDEIYGLPLTSLCPTTLPSVPCILNGACTCYAKECPSSTPLFGLSTKSIPSISPPLPRTPNREVMSPMRFLYVSCYFK